MKTNNEKMINWTNCKDKEKKIMEAKEKLHWYTFEAMEEEFDVEEIDALVDFLKEVEPELGMETEGDHITGGCASTNTVCEWMSQESANERLLGVKRTLTWGKNRKGNISRIVKLYSSRIAIAVIGGGLVFALLGTSIGNTQAWENGGFLRWIKKDKEGQIMITLPDELGMEEGIERKYEDKEKIPEEYQQYLVELEEIEILECSKIVEIIVTEMPAFQSISMRIETDEKFEIKLGVIVFENNFNVVRDSYDEFEYQLTKATKNGEQDVYTKRSIDRNIEYAIFCYDANKKFFVLGKDDVEFLSEVLEEYIQYIEK